MVPASLFAFCSHALCVDCLAAQLSVAIIWPATDAVPPSCSSDLRAAAVLTQSRTSLIVPQISFAGQAHSSPVFTYRTALCAELARLVRAPDQPRCQALAGRGSRTAIPKVPPSDLAVGILQ